MWDELKIETIVISFKIEQNHLMNQLCQLPVLLI